MNSYREKNVEYAALLDEKIRLGSRFKKDARLQPLAKLFWMVVESAFKPLAFVESDRSELEDVGRSLSGLAKTNARAATFTKVITGSGGAWVKRIAQMRALIEEQILTPGPTGDFLADLTRTIGPDDVNGIQAGLEGYIDGLLHLMTTRPEPPSQTFVTDVTRLKAPQSRLKSGGCAEAVDPERERAMLARIAGTPAPLLVQLGDAHREHLQTGGLPADVIAVPMCEASEAGSANDPFVAATTAPDPVKTNWLLWGAVAATFAAVAVAVLARRARA
jgi:hypothetical protein